MQNPSLLRLRNQRSENKPSNLHLVLSRTRWLGQLRRPKFRTVRNEQRCKLQVWKPIHGRVIQRRAPLCIKLINMRSMLKQTAQGLGVDCLRTVVDRTKTRRVWRVDVRAMVTEEADYVRPLQHLGYLGVNFAGAEGEV